MSAIIKDNDVVLFQGDSVTDAGRDRENDGNLGGGYPSTVAAWFTALNPSGNVKFLNRGISGNRVRDLRDRWVEDCLEIKPSLVSILIGINDCWRRYDSNDPTSAEKFEEDYRYILTQIKENLKDTRILICEPFVLSEPEDRKKWREDLDPKIHVVRKLASEFQTLYVPLDGLFAQASVLSKPAIWSPDGVHPSPAGHALIAKAWLEAVKAI